MRISARISASRIPCPSLKPTVRLRDRSPVQVSTRSPMPARPAKVAGLGPHGLPQAVHLGQAAGDQRGPGVVAEPETVTDAGGDGDDVLDRPAQLDPDHIRVGVDPQAGAAEGRLHPPGSSLVAGCGHDQRRQPLGHFAGKGGAGQGHKAAGQLSRQQFRADLGYRPQGFQFDPLGGVGNNRIRGRYAGPAASARRA